MVRTLRCSGLSRVNTSLNAPISPDCYQRQSTNYHQIIMTTERSDSLYAGAKFNTKENSVVFEPIKVEYIDHMGSDKRICNVARVSMDKWEDESEPLSKRDEGLLAYLATGVAAQDRDDYEKLYKASQHWSPFAHVIVQLRCTVPFALGNQLHKHQVGIVRNEMSRRYVDSKPSYWLPDVFHVKPDNVKQGSGGIHPYSDIVRQAFVQQTNDANEFYEQILKMRVAPEEARFALPFNAMTSFIFTGSLAALMRVVNQRTDDHAQLMAQEFGHKLYEVVNPLFPVASTVLRK